MGLMTGVNPPVDPETFMEAPYRERIKVLSRFWAEYGFGAPKITAFVYVAKLLVLYICGGVLVATLTSHLNPFHVKAWWQQPIVWQKAVVWTMFLEAVGLAGSWGPLAGHFKPMTGGILYWARTRTLRNPPWSTHVPFTEGDERTPVDVVLYVGFLLALATALALPGTHRHGVDAMIAGNKGLIPAVPLIVAVVLLGLLGLRDKIAFLAARSEQYAPLLVMFAVFPFVDMVVGAKLLIVCVWVGASISKLGNHFGCVIPPMVSNTPWLSSRTIKKKQYRSFPEDLRPSKFAVLLSHGPGSLVEFAVPLVLLFSHNHTLTVIAAAIMIGFHLFITSTFPLAVPLEWNALFMFLVGQLFLRFPATDGFDLAHMGAGPLVLCLVAFTALPILGENRPDLVSFLPSMRQYAGNWASAMWVFAPGCEEKLNEGLVKPALMQKDQLQPTLKISEAEAEVVMQQLLGWRALHSQGRALNSIMLRHLGEDLDHYTPREAEFSCNAITGFNFGDGHFHDEHLLAAIQKRCHFAPGEFTVAWIESEPIFRNVQQYWVWDAGVGIVERGSYKVTDAVAEQPWLPNGPIRMKVEWQMPGYERRRHGPGATAANGGRAGNGRVRADAPNLRLGSDPDQPVPSVPA